MTPCYYCERECDEERDPFSVVADSFLHRRCLTWRLKRRTEYDAGLHRVATEFGRQKASPGIRALECRNGHAYTSENTYLDRRGHQQCRTCSRAHWQRYHERHPGRSQERRKA